MAIIRSNTSFESNQYKIIKQGMPYSSVSQLPGGGLVPGPDINYTGPREVNFTLNDIINFW
jgi:hypothetical protein